MFRRGLEGEFSDALVDGHHLRAKRQKL